MNHISMKAILSRVEPYQHESHIDAGCFCSCRYVAVAVCAVLTPFVRLRSLLAPTTPAPYSGLGAAHSLTACGQRIRNGLHPCVLCSRPLRVRILDFLLRKKPLRFNNPHHFAIKFYAEQVLLLTLLSLAVIISVVQGIRVLRFFIRHGNRLFKGGCCSTYLFFCSFVGHVFNCRLFDTS